MWGDGSVPMPPLFLYGQLTLIQYFHQSKDLVGAWSVLGRCLVGAWSVCNLTFEYQRYTVRPYPVFRFGQSGFATLGHHQSYAASPAFQNLPLVQDIGQQWICGFDSCSDLIFSAFQSGGKVPGFLSPRGHHKWLCPPNRRLLCTTCG